MFFLIWHLQLANPKPNIGEREHRPLHAITERRIVRLYKSLANKSTSKQRLHVNFPFQQWKESFRPNLNGSEGDEILSKPSLTHNVSSIHNVSSVIYVPFYKSVICGIDKHRTPLTHPSVLHLVPPCPTEMSLTICLPSWLWYHCINDFISPVTELWHYRYDMLLSVHIRTDAVCDWAPVCVNKHLDFHQTWLMPHWVTSTCHTGQYNLAVPYACVEDAAVTHVGGRRIYVHECVWLNANVAFLKQL